MSERHLPRVPSFDEIAEWTAHERSAVARRLDALVPRQHSPENPAKRRRFVIALTAVSTVVLVPWIIYLSTTLPETSSGGAWRTAWVGFDVLLATSLALSAWALWRRREIAIVFLSTTAIALLLDAWFDITLSWGTLEEPSSLLTSFLVELPVLLVIVATIRTMLRRNGEVIAALRGTPIPRSVFQQPMPMAPASTIPGHDPSTV